MTRCRPFGIPFPFLRQERRTLCVPVVSFLLIRFMISRFLLSFLLPLGLLASCGPDKHTARLTGNIKGVDQAAIIAYASAESPADGGGTDSIRLSRGAFSYDRPVSEPMLLTLVYPNFSTLTLVAVPGEEVHLSGEANRLKEVEISGGEDNELLQGFRSGNHGRSDADIRRKAEAFIRSHPKSLAAVAVFLDIFASAERLRARPDGELLDLLVKSQPNNAQLKRIAAHLRPVFATAEGAKLPRLAERTLSGETFTNEKIKGRCALVVFSASWDSSNYRLVSKLRTLRRRFGQRLAVVNVLMDTDEEKARTRAQRDSLVNAIYAPGEYESPLARKLGVRYVPGTLLVDAGGTIVARDIDVEHLESEVEKVVR